MELMVHIFFFIGGMLFGSFLNVFILRYNTGKGIAGRSRCQSCGKTLFWYELIPFFSYLFLHGRCSSCKSRISLQYPLVEVLVGILFLCVSFTLTNPFEITYTLISLWLLVAIGVYDLRHRIIPDPLVYTLSGLAFFALFVNFEALTVHMPQSASLLSGIIIAFPLFLLWYVSHGRWIGLGDAKLALFMGWFLGISSGALALIYSFWIGAVVSVLCILVGNILRRNKLNLFGKNLTIKSEIPFAPFMIVSILLVYFLHLNLGSLLLF